MSATVHAAINNAADLDYSATQRRGYAVAAALEVIIAKAGQGGAHQTYLEVEMGRLSEYADKIQAALTVK